MAQNRFLDEGYELENAWVSTGNNQKLTKEEIASINEIVVSEGKFGMQATFMMKSGKPKRFTMSAYGEQHPAGTKLRPSSIEIQEITNDEGELKYRVIGDAM